MTILSVSMYKCYQKYDIELNGFGADDINTVEFLSHYFFSRKLSGKFFFLISSIVVFPPQSV